MVPGKRLDMICEVFVVEVLFKDSIMLEQRQPRPYYHESRFDRLVDIHPDRRRRLEKCRSNKQPGHSTERRSQTPAVAEGSSQGSIVAAQ